MKIKFRVVKYKGDSAGSRDRLEEGLLSNTATMWVIGLCAWGQAGLGKNTKLQGITDNYVAVLVLKVLLKLSFSFKIISQPLAVDSSDTYRPEVNDTISKHDMTQWTDTVWDNTWKNMFF